VEDRGNPDEVERSGPFLCSRSDAWLGEGYYFWESFIDNAHWWGANAYPEKYMICRAFYVHDSARCLDLNTPEGIKIIEGVIIQMKQDGLVSNNIYISRMIEYLKNIGRFHWEAVRVTPTSNRHGNDSPHRERAMFNERYGISLRPAIQICFYSKTALQLSGYKIIYPDEYMAGYVV
jgi:hypothetical protein